MRNILLLFVILSLYNCNSKVEKRDSSEIRLNEIITKVDSTSAFNGIVGILRKGEKPHIVYHGFKSPKEKSSKLDSSDYFHLASNSKLFTGFAILKVMNEFDLKHTDSIAPFFPELHPELQRVTIQQLANHTCAIHDYFSLVDEPNQITNKQALNLISHLDSTVYEPGLRWGYTNSGYVLLSLLVERVTQRGYNDYLKQEILSPLGITNAQLHPNKINALKGYENNQLSQTLSITTGDAGIFITSQDLIEFFENQDKMSAHIDEAKMWSSPWRNEEWRYGFGWFFSEDTLGKFRAHSGKSSGFESYIRISDTNDLMIFVLSNNVNGSAKLIRKKIIEELIKTTHNKTYKKH